MFCFSSVDHTSGNKKYVVILQLVIQVKESCKETKHTNQIEVVKELVNNHLTEQVKISFQTMRRNITDTQES